MNFFPNAKINLGLNITERRTDGFHNIESIFVPILWRDELEIIESNQTSFASSGIVIPGNAADNLCLKAYYLLKSEHDLPSVRIHLKKNIPIGAGLGGGSSDAAFVIKGLNELFQIGLTVSQMQNFARKLGSDCAFFIQNKPVFAFGKGDEFEDINLELKDKFIVLVYPNEHISTAMAYSGVKPKFPQYSLKSIIEMPMKDWREFMINDFETSIFKQVPRLLKIKQELYAAGAIYAAMSGSGSTLFGIFDSNPPVIKMKDTQIHICKL
jgi:4-diphosphocytidyl-2-C-methyl-D-erythritol kinase